LVSRRNISSEEAALVCAGKLFHAGDAATGNALIPRVDRRVHGTSVARESLSDTIYKCDDLVLIYLANDGQDRWTMTAWTDCSFPTLLVPSIITEETDLEAADVSVDHETTCRLHAARLNWFEGFF